MEKFDGRKGKKLSHNIAGDLRFFGYYIGNETLLINKNEDTSIIFEKSDVLGNVFGIQLFGYYDEKGNSTPRVDKNVDPLLEYFRLLNSGANQKPIFPFTQSEVRESKNWRAVITRFMTELGNRKLETIPLKNYKKNYADDVIDYGNSMEMLTAIFCNVLRMDANHNVINEDWARYRTSQYIRSFNDNSYVVKPSLKQWEMWLWI